MKLNNVQYIGPYQCPFTLKGENIAEIRRAKLRLIAKGVKVNPELPHNQMLQQVMQKLNAIEAPHELSELKDFA